MPYQIELTANQVSNLIEALEFYARFQWGQVAHLPLSLDCSERMRHLQRDEVEESLKPFRQLVWPDLRGWGHSLGVGWVEGASERQAAQIAWEMSRTILTARNNHINVASLYSSNWPLHYSPEPLPRLTWVGPPEAPEQAAPAPAPGADSPTF
jgi:hypothetical protein